jgi:hypothetical protein
MTKLIAALIVIGVLFVAWKLFVYWDDVNHERESVRQQAAAAEITRWDQLQGVPDQLGKSLNTAESQGGSALGAWLKTHGSAVKDPAKAWIELDYCVAVTRENPTEAKRVFADVKGRITKSSPVYPRLEKLAKTYE